MGPGFLGPGSPVRRPFRTVGCRWVSWACPKRKNPVDACVYGVSGTRTILGGQRGIRTPDTLLTYTRFPGVRLQPLGHLSFSVSRRRTTSRRQTAIRDSSKISFNDGTGRQHGRNRPVRSPVARTGAPFRPLIISIIPSTCSRADQSARTRTGTDLDAGVLLPSAYCQSGISGLHSG